MPVSSTRNSTAPVFYSLLLTLSLLLMASLWLYPLGWQKVSAALGQKESLETLVPSVALALHGPWQPGLSLEVRRDQLAQQLGLVKRALPALIILEDWLDVPLKEASSILGAKLQAGVAVLVPLGATRRKGQFKSLSETVSALKSSRAFKVSTKNGKRQKLKWRWQIARQPQSELLRASAGSAVVETEPGKEGEVPLVFQVRRRWLPSMGLEALLRYWSIPRKGLRFIFNTQGRLESLELKGVRHSITKTGMGRLPANEKVLRLPEYALSQVITDPALFKGIRGKVVFFRPWPAQVGDAKVFDRQRALFAALLNEVLLTSPLESGPSRIAGFVFGTVFLLLLFLGPRASWSLTGSVSLVLAAFSLAGSLLVVHAAAAAAALLLWTSGLNGLRSLKNGRGGENAFSSVVAPARMAAWHKRFIRPGKGGTLKGVYLAAMTAQVPISFDFARWMEKNDAFLDPGERDKVAIFLPLGAQGRLPIDAVWDLYETLGKVGMVFCSGNVHFEPGLWLDQFRWVLSGQTKLKVEELSKKALTERLLTTELEYQLIRKRVKIQMMETQHLAGEEEETKIFNILEILS